MRVNASLVDNVPSPGRGPIVVGHGLGGGLKPSAMGVEGVSVEVLGASHWGRRRHRINHVYRVVRAI